MANNCTTPKEIKLTDKQIREYNIFLNENQKNGIEAISINRLISVINNQLVMLKKRLHKLERKNSCLMYNYINF
jgi:hypothetical protein